MNYSYWELKEWFSNVDFTIVGSGIVGLNCAINLRERFPKAKIIVLEKGMLPQGASTKNAGFACFGSLSEILDDLKTNSEEEVYNLVHQRWKGLQLLRKNLGDKNIDFQQNKGFELFESVHFFEECVAKKSEINNLLKPIFKDDVFSVLENIFRFQNISSNYVVNNFEGQIDTGKMMSSLLKLAHQKNIRILNNICLEKFEDLNDKVFLKTNISDFYTSKLIVSNNGFANKILEENVKPARAQVLITKPIKNLHIKGTFHLEQGYYYFRNIDNRILFGGGRNLDFETEETSEFGLTHIIQNRLEELLRKTILPNHTFEIDHRWSGIMGVGNQKKAIVKQVSNNVFCGVRLGGMGVAIGSLIGKDLSDLLY